MWLVARCLTHFSLVSCKTQTIAFEMLGAVEVATLLKRRGFTVHITTTPDTKLTNNILLAAVRSSGPRNM